MSTYDDSFWIPSSFTDRKLANALLEIGFSNNDIAEMVGVSRSTVGIWKRKQIKERQDEELRSMYQKALDEQLYAWFLTIRSSGEYVTTKMVLEKAKEIICRMTGRDHSIPLQWIMKWRNRHGIISRKPLKQTIPFTLTNGTQEFETIETFTLPSITYPVLPVPVVPNESYPVQEPTAKTDDEEDTAELDSLLSRIQRRLFDGYEGLLDGYKDDEGLSNTEDINDDPESVSEMAIKEEEEEIVEEEEIEVHATASEDEDESIIEISDSEEEESKRDEDDDVIIVECCPIVLKT